MHSGYDLIRAILARWPSVRVVAITGSVVSGRQAALAAGAAGCLAKPFTSLQEVCDFLLEGKA
jgi:CheY-like chemotaxis protein